LHRAAKDTASDEVKEETGSFRGIAYISVDGLLEGKFSPKRIAVFGFFF